MARIRNVDHSKDWIEWVRFGIGFTLYILWNAEYTMPLGFVWGCGKTDKVFDVAGSYVPQFARRLGVRSALNAKILEHYPIVVTPKGSPSGMRFMKATGYRYSRETDSWYRNRKAKV